VPGVTVTPTLPDATACASNDSAESQGAVASTSPRGPSILYQRADAARRAFCRADALVSIAQGYLRGDAYMAHHWAAFGEQLVAFASVAKDLHGVLLPLLLEDCEDCELTLHVQSLVKLDFRDPTREAWDAEIDRLRRYLGRPAAPESDLACPYPGMRPFTESDAGRYFGREVELDNIEYRLRHGEREIYVIGASGSGKSSLIGAA
jgi:hypothetical protein